MHDRSCIEAFQFWLGLEEYLSNGRTMSGRNSQPSREALYHPRYYFSAAEMLPRYRYRYRDFIAGIEPAWLRGPFCADKIPVLFRNSFDRLIWSVMRWESQRVVFTMTRVTDIL